MEKIYSNRTKVVNCLEVMNLTQLILGLSALGLGASMPLSYHSSVIGAVHNQSNPLVTPLVARSKLPQFIGAVKNVQGDLRFRIPLTGYQLYLNVADVSGKVQGIKKVFVLRCEHEGNTETRIKGLTDRYSDVHPSVLDAVRRMMGCRVKILDFESEQERIDFENSPDAGALWNHRSNAYVRYPHLTNPRDKVLKKLERKLKDRLTIPDKAFLQIHLDSNYRPVNGGFGGMEQLLFELKRQLVNAFGLRQRILVRI